MGGRTRCPGATIETGVGSCHVYVHQAADLDVSRAYLAELKTRRPSVCNAAETLLVDAAIAETALPRCWPPCSTPVSQRLDPDEGRAARIPVAGHRGGGGQQCRRCHRPYRMRHRAQERL